MPVLVRSSRLDLWLGLLGAACLLALCLIATPQSRLQAQDPPGTVDSSEDAPSEDAPPEAAPSSRAESKGINIFTLLIKGGRFMIPILGMSLLVVTFAVERWLGLRRNKVLPEELVTELGQLATTAGGFDPRKAYRICQNHPSAASTVIRSMLLKVGRPQTEVEHAVSESSEREAERLYANVRWLNLSAAVTPLLGLMGTVWGMIRAFHDTTQLLPGQNKADYLAEGIYVALVTTLGGLAVAIPAAIIAHYFEGRIQNLFHQIDELLFSLMPQVERYEGRVRFSRQFADADDAAPPAADGAGSQAVAASPK